MKYYLLENNGKYKIVTVHAHQVKAFLEECPGIIKTEANSLSNLLQQLGKLQL